MKLEALSVAVTGGAGFIGSHLVDALMARRNRVVVVDDLSTGSEKNLTAHRGSPSFRLLRSDVRSLSEMERAFEGVDVVFHLATHCVRASLVDPQTNHDVNST